METLSDNAFVFGQDKWIETHLSSLCTGSTIHADDLRVVDSWPLVCSWCIYNKTQKMPAGHICRCLVQQIANKMGVRCEYISSFYAHTNALFVVRVFFVCFPNWNCGWRQMGMRLDSVCTSVFDLVMKGIVGTVRLLFSSPSDSDTQKINEPMRFTHVTINTEPCRSVWRHLGSEFTSISRWRIKKSKFVLDV